jgi:hypothetical protein
VRLNVDRPLVVNYLGWDFTALASLSKLLDAAIADFSRLLQIGDGSCWPALGDWQH